MVIGWFTRIIVVFAVIGVLGFDTLTLTSAHLGAQEDANNAASNVAAAWQSSHTAVGAYAAAVAAGQTALSHGETLVPGSVVVAPNGNVTLQVHRLAAHTLVAHDIGLLRHLVTFDATGSATPPVS